MRLCESYCELELGVGVGAWERWESDRGRRRGQRAGGDGNGSFWREVQAPAGISSPTKILLSTT